MIATNGGRARPKLRNRESLFARIRITNGCVTSRNILFVVVNDDGNDNTSILKSKKKKGASVRRKELQARVEGKFEIKKKLNLFPTTYATIRFHLAYVGSVR